MKTIALKSLTILFLCSSVLTFAQEKFNADTDNSVVYWKGSKPTGDHNGTVKVKTGFFNISDKGISGEFDIDMTSIINLDLEAGSKYNTKLVNHLKSEDFFSVEKFPTATFKVTKSEVKGEKTLITGNLSIKGITHEISFLATVHQEAKKLHVKSDTFTIDRSKWEVKYKSTSFFADLGDKFIYDDIELSFDVVANQ
ncbi:YceI family protein [Lutimonas sp.]|uniref:YceI family protein n=1 Tax=Lutimonas sp. TaxID=1872403 RepID=UPI003D9AED48